MRSIIISRRLLTLMVLFGVSLLVLQFIFISREAVSHANVISIHDTFGNASDEASGGTGPVTSPVAQPSPADNMVAVDSLWRKVGFNGTAFLKTLVQSFTNRKNTQGDARSNANGTVSTLPPDIASRGVEIPLGILAKLANMLSSATKTIDEHALSPRTPVAETPPDTVTPALQKNCDVTYSSHTDEFHTYLEEECKKHDERIGLISKQPDECNEKLPVCPCLPDHLHGPIPIKTTPVTWDELHARHADVRNGYWSPANCRSHYRVAIVIPYRDREEHLTLFFQHMVPFLQKQLITFAFYVVEQDGASKFNRAMLMNIGYVEALKDLRGFQCFIFTDVDLLPENDNNVYGCPAMPRHMSVAVNTLGYRLPYTQLFGGTVAIRTEQFLQVNGFSNVYFGWGGEDDDLSKRITGHGLSITRYPSKIARYHMSLHQKSKETAADRFDKLIKASSRFTTDGINSLTYQTRLREQRKMFTIISVTINQTEVYAKANFKGR